MLLQSGLTRAKPITVEYFLPPMHLDPGPTVEDALSDFGLLTQRNKARDPHLLH
jgi:hypothetical protein